MFSITSQQTQYLTYQLTDHTHQSCLTVVPERGGIITSWQVNGQELLYLDQERFADPSLSVRGGIPILFPICGNLPNNTYTLNSQSYTLKQHGFARDLAWEVGDQVVDEQASLTLNLHSTDQTRAVYPFDFHLAFTYRLVGHTLEIHQRYTNHSPDPMPFSTGLHPYFTVTDKTQLEFQIPSGEFYDQRQGTSHPFNGQFDFTAAELDLAFRDLTSQTAQVRDRSNSHTLTLSSDTPYSTLVFWTLHDKPFYCLEPWTAGRNALNTGENLLYLEPGASWETWVRLEVGG